MPEQPIYLDYHATTPCDPLVIEEMLPWFGTRFGNASSRQHRFGWEASEAVKLAREQTAALIGADPEEIVFTSGATESLNLAIKGTAEALSGKGKHIVTAETEHSAVLDTCRHLERLGYELTYLPVDGNGQLDPEQLERALRSDTILVAIMWANNETGVIQDMHALSSVIRARDIWFLSDATQAVGKISLDLDLVDMLAFSAHKFYGPKGTGALYVRRRGPRVRIMPQLDGGGHEKGIRSGTLNVPGIVGMGKAAELAVQLMQADMTRLAGLKAGFEASMKKQSDVYINAVDAPRLPTVTSLSFPFMEGSALLAAATRHLAISTGSACASSSLEPSHVLTAMGLGRELAFASLRISFGRPTTLYECEEAASMLTEALAQTRKQSPTWQMYEQGILEDLQNWKHPLHEA
jgi:cysteine desulfurase